MQIASRQCLWKDTIATQGTFFEIEVADANRTARIASGSLAFDSQSVTIWWGDGASNTYSKISNATHTYSKSGTYLVRISDDISSFGYANGSTNNVYKDMLRELICLGSKVRTIASYGFNNCHYMRGVMNLPSVTTIGGYAFGTTLGITDYILPSMTRLVQESFYACSSPTQIHADNVKQIDSRFWDYYGWRLYDVYLRNSTCAQIKAMSGFPFGARDSRVPEQVRFHGSDGIVLADGTIIQN